MEAIPIKVNMTVFGIVFQLMFLFLCITSHGGSSKPRHRIIAMRAGAFELLPLLYALATHISNSFMI